jgi:hypothetical protein
MAQPQTNLFEQKHTPIDFIIIQFLTTNKKKQIRSYKIRQALVSLYVLFLKALIYFSLTISS